MTHIMNKGSHKWFWLKHQKERDHLEYLGIYGRITLKLILKKQMGWCGTDLPGSEEGQAVDSCRYDIELWVPLHEGNFLSS